MAVDPILACKVAKSADVESTTVDVAGMTAVQCRISRHAGRRGRWPLMPVSCVSAVKTSTGSEHSKPQAGGPDGDIQAGPLVALQPADY